MKISNLSTNLSDLPRDMAEEVLSKIPMTSLRRVRSTCRKWNSLSRCRSFAKKHLRQARVATQKEKGFKVVMMMDYRVFWMRVNLDKEIGLCIKPEGKLVCIDDASDQTDVCQVFHCDGLLLCVTKDKTRLVLWNPYWGQTRWIYPAHNDVRLNIYSYALGYDMSNNTKSYKVLTFTLDYEIGKFFEFKIYDLNSDSWRVLDVTQDWIIEFYSRGVSLKGNTYWFARERNIHMPDLGFLLCFDFTREIFGPRLSIPVEWYAEDTLTLSSVRDEQLALLFQRWDTYRMEIWVTTKIEPNKVSWSNKFFLSVNMKALTGRDFQFALTSASFFIDEEKKVAVVFEKDKDRMTRNVAYIIGEDGSLKEADLGESPYRNLSSLVCSYVPSLVQLQ